MSVEPPSGPAWFTGRAAELTHLDRLAAASAAGRAWTVLVEGEAGIGRTALVRRFVRSLSDVSVWWAACDRHETGLAYGVVAQFYRRDRHPWSERVPRALPADEVGLHLLRSMVAIARARSLVVVIDDAQWIDEPSLGALGYALRRLDPARVLVVATLRTPAHEAVAAGLRRLVADREPAAVLRLPAFTADEVYDLAERAGVPVGMPVALRLHEHVAGHPGHAVAVLRELARGERTCDTFPVPPEVTGRVRRLLAGLTEPATRLLGALAVLAEPWPLAVVAGIADVTDAAEHLGPLVAGGLVRWWPQSAGRPVAIASRLDRDAVYRSLDPALLRRSHRRVADRGDGRAALEHRLAAADGPDDDLADALADTNDSLLLLGAADLTTDRERRDERLLLAAAGLVLEWRWDRLAELEPRITRSRPGPLRSLALGAMAAQRGELPPAESALAETLGTPADDPARELLPRAWLRIAAYCAEHDQGKLAGVLARWVLAEPDGEPALRQQAAVLAADADGRTKDGPVTALRTLARLAPAQDAPATAAARGRWQLRAGRLTEAVTTLSTLDDIAAYPGVPAELALARQLLGDWPAAVRGVGPAVTAVERSASPATRSFGYGVAACVLAPAGRLDRATELMLAARSWQADDVSWAALAAATIAQTRADHTGMLAALRPILELPLSSGHARYTQLWWRPLQAEALIGVGSLPEAGEAVRWLADLAKRTPALRCATAWLRGWLAERLGDVDEARLRYENGLAATPDADDVPLHRARLDHAYGLFLLGRGNRRLAVTHLRQAFACYSRLGAQPFAQRCAADLADSGLPVSGGQPAGPLAVLSAKEHQVAHLVAAGLTNQQVGKEIYISVKTVEFHLGNIFTKLGITSRKDLAALVAESAVPARRSPDDARGSGQGSAQGSVRGGAQGGARGGAQGGAHGSANSSISLIATSGGVPPE